jgi:hypothetical protein
VDSGWLSATRRHARIVNFPTKIKFGFAAPERENFATEDELNDE